MIQPLLAEVERLRGVMQTHRDYLGKTEAATRYAVIDPVLGLLGWDVHEATSVLAEYRSGSASTTFVDYALLRDGQPVALIEAKALGVALADNHLEQLSNYCVNCQPRSVRWGILTNGDRWRLIDAFRVQQPLPERVVLDCSLNGGHSLDALNGLLSLFGLISGHVERPVAQVVDAPEARQAAKRVPSRPPAATETTLSSAGELTVHALGELVALCGTVTRPAVALIFPDGTVFEARQWGAVLTGVLEWLAAKDLLTLARCPLPDAAGRKRYLVAAQPQHPGGKSFTAAHALANGVHYHLNYDSADIVRNALHALSALGVAPESVRWRQL